MHRQRVHPCAHANVDPYRIVRQPPDTALPFASMHNGLLIYCGRRLVFADTVLDGHGWSILDLQRQIERSRRDADRGVSLPEDFKR